MWLRSKKIKTSTLSRKFMEYMDSNSFMGRTLGGNYVGKVVQCDFIKPGDHRGRSRSRDDGKEKEKKGSQAESFQTAEQGIVRVNEGWAGLSVGAPWVKVKNLSLWKRLLHVVMMQRKSPRTC